MTGLLWAHRLDRGIDLDMVEIGRLRLLFVALGPTPAAFPTSREL